MGHHRVKINPSLAKAILSCHGGETTVFKALKPEDIQGLKDTARHHGYIPPKAMAKKSVEAFHQFLQRRGKVFEPKSLTNEDAAYPMWGKSNHELEDRIKKSKIAHQRSHGRGDPEVSKYFRKDAERHEDELNRRKNDKPWWVKESNLSFRDFIGEGFVDGITKTKEMLKNPKDYFVHHAHKIKSSGDKSTVHDLERLHPAERYDHPIHKIRTVLGRPDFHTTRDIVDKIHSAKSDEDLHKIYDHHKVYKK